MAEVKEKPITLESIKADLGAAIVAGNDVEVQRLAKAIGQYAKDIQKAEGDKLKAEGVALAGDREKLEIAIYNILDLAELSVDLAKVKSKGFTITVDHNENDKGQLDANGPVKVTGACKLTVPTIKARAFNGGGSRSTGLIKEQTGMSRSELIAKFGTDAEKATIKAAFDNAEIRPDAARYTAEKAPVKRILAENPELIKK